MGTIFFQREPDTYTRACVCSLLVLVWDTFDGDDVLPCLMLSYVFQDQIMVRVVPDATLDDDAMGGAAAEEEGPGPLLTALQDRDGNFDFTMTNPPFFASEKEVRQYDE